MQPQAVSVPPDAELAGAGPRLADGVELLGPYRGSGYREARYVVARADGQVVQVSELLYRLAEAMDSPGTPAELAGRLSAGLGRDVAATQVMSLIDTKLRPAGLVAGGGTAAPGDPRAAEQRPDHLMMLRHRLPVVPRGRGHPARRRWPHQHRHRRAPRPLGPHGRSPPRPHLREAGNQQQIGAA